MHSCIPCRLTVDATLKTLHILHSPSQNFPIAKFCNPFNKEKLSGSESLKGGRVPKQQRWSYGAKCRRKIQWAETWRRVWGDGINFRGRNFRMTLLSYRKKIPF